MSFSPGDHSDWLSVDDADVRVAGLRRAVLERRGKEKRRLHILLKCLAVLRHTDVTDDGYGHPQVSTCTCATTQSRDLQTSIAAERSSKRAVRLAGGGRSLTCRILLADEAHQLHEGRGDALLVQVVSSCHARPVTRRVQSLLVLHLTHLWVVPHVSTDGEGAGLGVGSGHLPSRGLRWL